MNFKENLVVEEASALSGKTVSEFVAKSAYVRAKHLLAQRSRFSLDKANYNALRSALDTCVENRSSTASASGNASDYLNSPSVEKLEIRHEVDNFDCGEDGLNIWIRRLAISFQLMEIAQTYVIQNDSVVIGYYTLKEEYFPVPDGSFSLATRLLLHLAVDKQFQGKGFGQALVHNAINRFIQEQQTSSAKLLLVQAERASLQSWYQKIGFTPLVAELPVLFLASP
ncbi:GNAT family N-acetyltransferase [Herbaspirillum sp. RU 5E]|nr:GNAT family N-acetyltransferase [Herbaspirillum sp. RU 5E]